MTALFNTESTTADHSGIAIGGDNYGIASTGTIVIVPPGVRHRKLTINWHRPKHEDFELLRWNTRISDLQGREKELADLLEWAQKGQGIRARFVTGEGGVGKTRLAMECGSMLREKEGWEAGTFDIQKDDPVLFGVTGTFLIIDYPEENREKIRSFLRELSLQEESPNLCILFLTRNAPTFWRDDLRETGASTFFAGESPIHLLGMEGVSEPYSIFSQAWQKVQDLFGVISTASLLPAENEFRHWLARDAFHRRPLMIVACALQHHHDSKSFSLAGAQIVEALVDRELVRLRRESKAADLGEHCLPRLMVMAALRRGLTTTDIKNLENHPELEIISRGSEQVVDRLHTIGRMKDGLLPAPEPDIVAAVLVVEAIKKRHDLASKWFWHAIEDNMNQGLETFGRLSYDAEYVLGYGEKPINSILSAACKGHYDRCLKLAEHIVMPSSISLFPLKIVIWETLAINASDDFTKAGFLNNLCDAFHQVGCRNEALKAAKSAVAIYGRLVSTSSDDYEQYLAMGLNNIGTIYSDMGQHNEALTVAMRAMEIYKRLFSADPDTYVHYLATSYNNLGTVYSSLGRRDEAVNALELAVEICEELATSNPETYDPNLAESLNNLGIMYSFVGRRDEGIKAAALAVEISERLARAKPNIYERDLASSLNTLGHLLSEEGRHDEALMVAERTTEIYDRLARVNPEAYEPHLAVSLNNLGNRYFVAGRRDEALMVAGRALEIREGLGCKNPDAYNPDLAMSLINLGNFYVEVNQRNEGLKMFERAIGIYQCLVHDNPDVYEPLLASCLNNLAYEYSEIGQRDNALKMAEQAIEIYERLTLVDAGVYHSLLARSLNDLGGMLWKLGRIDEGIKIVERAAKIRKTQALLTPDTYEPDLAIVLYNLGIMYATIGRLDEALRLAESANEIYQRLACAHPDDWQPQLVESFNSLGAMYSRLGRSDEALKVAECARAIRERLACVNADTMRLSEDP